MLLECVLVINACSHGKFNQLRQILILVLVEIRQAALHSVLFLFASSRHVNTVVFSVTHTLLAILT